MDRLDVITMGRSSVDLYGAQIGGRLEDMASFNKYIGGSPTNTAAGAARLGLKPGLITAVGDEHMGRFITETLQAEGVDTKGVKIDPHRLTALVILGIRDQTQFPLIFYRENCADMGLTEADVDPAYIASAGAFVASGTHLSHPRVEAATLKAVRLARENRARTALDLDYRPNLWGVAGHGDGESRFVESQRVTAKLQSTLHWFDVIVGTAEEFAIAGGTTDTVAALRNVRTVTAATLVLKRGPMGATAYTGDIPDDLDDGISGPGFPVEVFNVLGAGDGFMGGLLRGWLRDEDWRTSLTYANACGALAVSRHGCTPAYPSWAELTAFLDRGVRIPAVRHDDELEQIHWATNRRVDWPTLRVFAFDHRSQLEDLAESVGADPARIGPFKSLCLQAVQNVAQGRHGYGLLCDARLGRDALYAAAGEGLWIGRPVEKPGTKPVQFEPDLVPDLGSALNEWPVEHTAKCLCFVSESDTAKDRGTQIERVAHLAAACRNNGLDFLLEVIPSPSGPADADVIAVAMEEFYAAGIFPDWWKLPPLTSEADWQKASAVIERHDPNCRGIVVLGLDAPQDALEASFAVAAKNPAVKGFAVGRTIFRDAAERWLAGTIDDAAAIADMSDRYARLCALWDNARANEECAP